jgi:hypothetical protein
MRVESDANIEVVDLSKNLMEREKYFKQSFKGLLETIRRSVGSSVAESDVPVEPAYVQEFVDDYEEVLRECSFDDWTPMVRFCEEIKVVRKDRKNKSFYKYSFITFEHMRQWKELIDRVSDGKLSNSN